jgi:hypothetical protein
MATDAWQSAYTGFCVAVSQSWLNRYVRFALAPPADEKACETSCNELLTIFHQGSVVGVRLSQPWPEFFGEFRAPDHPANRVPSNLERFMGNYLNVAFICGLILTLMSHPIKVCLLCVAQVVALLGPPEIFDVQVLQPKSWGGGFADLGGSKLRFLLAVHSHGWLLALQLVSERGRLGLCLAVLASLVHAFFRVRPWTVMAKERLGTKKTK